MGIYNKYYSIYDVNSVAYALEEHFGENVINLESSFLIWNFYLLLLILLFFILMTFFNPKSNPDEEGNI